MGYLINISGIAHIFIAQSGEHVTVNENISEDDNVSLQDSIFKTYF